MSIEFGSNHCICPYCKKEFDSLVKRANHMEKEHSKEFWGDPKEIKIFEGDDVVNTGWMGKKMIAVFHFEKMKYDKKYSIIAFDGKKFDMILRPDEHLVLIPTD